MVFVCRPCSRCSGSVDRSVRYPTTGLWVWDAAGGAGGWASYCVLGAGVGRRGCLLYTSPSPRDGLLSRMPSSA